MKGVRVFIKITGFEMILRHCLQKESSDDREEDLVNGMVSGFYKDNDYRAISAKNLAAFIKLGLAHERVG